MTAQARTEHGVRHRNPDRPTHPDLPRPHGVPLRP
jgi:hypothetical protein